MQKRLLFVSFFIIFSLSAFATTPFDSIGVENSNGKQIILHKVEAKETYYSLSRRYNVPPKDIINYNNNQSLQIGAVLRIPTNRTYSATQANAKINTTSAVTNDTFIEYKVGPQESLYAISRRFNTTVDEIKRLNNLTSNALQIGQILKVKSVSNNATTNATEPPIQITNPTVSSVESDTDNTTEEEPLIKANKYGLREIYDKGVAIWIADENLDGSKMLALHRTAPVGTIVKITNPMTERSTFAKVVGKFTENESTKDVIIVVTKATADLLGALDKRFQVSLVYGVPNE